MNKIVIIIQARVGSTRLPGKVLKKILGKEILLHIVDRASKSKADKIVVATSDDKSNDPIRELCKRINVDCFSQSGDENNVLKRFYNAAKKYKADIIIRITGDCPLIDPEVINKLIDMFNSSSWDFVGVAAGEGVSNPDFKGNKYPQGLDAEIFPFKVLEKAYTQAVLKYDLEHVTPFIWKRPNIFKIGSLTGLIDYSDIKLVVDTQEDFNFVEDIFTKLYPINPYFGMKDVIRFLKLRTPKYVKEALKKQAQDIWEYFNYLLEICVDGGVLSKEMQETLMEGFEKKFMKFTTPKEVKNTTGGDRKYNIDG